MEKGAIYLFKNGEIKKQSKEECKTIYATRFYDEDLINYGSYLTRGYGLIDASNQNELLCLLPITMKEKDCDLFFTIYEELENMNCFSRFTLKNLRITSLGTDYDHISTNDSLLPALKVLLNEKKHQLSSYEEEMLTHYLNFSLEEALLEGDMKKYPELNHSDCGVLMIRKDGVEYRRGLHKQDHNSEVAALIHACYHENVEKQPLTNIVTKYGVIVGRLIYQESTKTAALGLSLPTYFTSTQRNKLKSLYEEIKQIQNKAIKTGNQVQLKSWICSHSNLTELADLGDYLNTYAKILTRKRY